MQNKIHVLISALFNQYSISLFQHSVVFSTFDVQEHQIMTPNYYILIFMNIKNVYIL